MRFNLLLFFLTVALALMFTPGRGYACDETQGSLSRNAYRSVIAETDMVYSIYTPPCYAQETRSYPVVYLMHGSNEDDGQWERLGLSRILNQRIVEGTLPSMIVVLPFGNWIANENQFEAVSWENVFLKELMPLVEGQYRVDVGRESRAVGGISRGGFWAFEIAFRHPEMFSIVGGHSAFFAEGNAPPDYDPLKLALNAPGIEKLRIALDRGMDDFAAEGLDLMSERLRERGIAHEYTIFPEGEHDRAYWEQHIREYLSFYAADWMRNPIPEFVLATNTPFAGTSVPEISSANQPGYDLFVPVAAFPSLQTEISVDALRAVRAGEVDRNLVLDESTEALLTQSGVIISSDTYVVLDEDLANVLWRDRRLYSLLPFDRLTSRYRMLRVEGQVPFEGDLSRYPFAFADDSPNFNPDQLTRLLLSGVTALTRLTREALAEKGVEWAGEAIRPYVEKADFFHTSNEVSFSPGCPESSITTLGEFCSQEEHFDLLRNIGLDIVELTGNHNNDYGTENYLTTFVWYREHDIQTVGGGENLEQARQPLILNHHGNRIAMLACNWAGPYYALASESLPGAAPCDWDWLRAVLPVLKAENDLVIVTIQYQEYEDYQPTPQQESDFQGVADLGADVVVGTQAHKPQTFEFYPARTGEEAFIHYGMGNLFFDQPFWGNMRFFMDNLLIYDGRLLTVDLFTGIIDDLARPRPMTPDEELNFLAFMFNTQGSF